MKKTFKILYTFIIGYILFNATEVFAFTTSLNGNKNIDANTSFTVTMSVSGANDLVALDAELTYDSNKLELSSFKGQDGWQTQVAKKIVGTNSNGLNGNSSIVTLTFKAKSNFAPGESTTISVTNVKGSNSNVERQTGNDASVTIKVNIPKSTNNNLSNLSVDEKTVSGFNASTTNYDLGTTTNNSINITATPEDSKAKINGLGNKTVNYGKNTFKVEVTAEDGSKKTYTITITKPDNRSTDNTLASLKASPLDLKFNKNTTNYSFKVEHNISSIDINAKATDSKASISGTGVKNLNDYVNTFDIVVTAENGSKKTYTIKVIRKDAEGNLGPVSKDNTLASLSIEGYDIQFNKDNLEYSIEVDNLVDNIKINAEVNDKTATYEITGNNNLSVGTNTVKINVVAENGDVKTYIIKVTRKSDSPSTTIKDLDTVLQKTTSNEIIIEIKDDNTILNKTILKIMKDSKKKFIINNYMENIITHTWFIDGKNINHVNDFDTNIKFDSNNKNEISKLTNYADSIYLNFQHSGDVPKGTKIKIYVGDKYQDGDKVNVYFYNTDKNKIDTIKSNIEVKNGYMEFEIKHCSEYIITKSILNQKKSTSISNYIATAEFILILSYIIYKIVTKIKVKEAPKKR